MCSFFLSVILLVYQRDRAICWMFGVSERHKKRKSFSANRIENPQKKNVFRPNRPRSSAGLCGCVWVLPVTGALYKYCGPATARASGLHYITPYGLGDTPSTDSSAACDQSGPLVGMAVITPHHQQSVPLQSVKRFMNSILRVVYIELVFL